jgi:hypothetical protein
LFDLTFILDIQRLDVPDGVSILIDAPIAAEEAHASNTGDALGNPLVLVLVRSVDEILRREVRVEVVRDEVIVAVLDNGIDESREGSLVAKNTILDGFEDLGQVWIDFVLAIEVVVTKIFHIFCQVAKEEDVLITCLTGDLDL